MKRILALGVGLLGMVLAGCSSEAAVEGKVTMKGAPVDGAMVLFVNDDGSPVGSGLTDGTGSFKIKTAQGKDKVPAGTYKVLVTKSKGVANAPIGTDPESMAKAGKDMMKNMKSSGAAKNELPEKFATAQSTSLKVTVPSKEAIELKLD